VAGIPAIVLGTLSLKQIRERGEGGQGMAIAGIVIGSVGVLAAIIIVVSIVAALHSPQ
jgi:hypothetical protein